jgi:hypothetical protein
MGTGRVKSPGVLDFLSAIPLFHSYVLRLRWLKDKIMVSISGSHLPATSGNDSFKSRMCSLRQITYEAFMKESKHGYSQAGEGILPKAIVVHDIGRSAKENKPRTIAFTAPRVDVHVYASHSVVIW